MSTTAPVLDSTPRPSFARDAAVTPPPTLPAVSAPASSAPAKVLLADLRRFHYGGPLPGAAALPEGLLPALWAAWRGHESATASAETPLSVLHARAQPAAVARRARFREHVAALHGRLQALLRASGDETRHPDLLGRALGAAAERHVDAVALALLTGQGRVEAATSATRRQRVEAALDAMARWLEAGAEASVVVLLDESLASRREALADAAIELHADACLAAAERFDREADRLAPLVRALRTARLEVEGAYDDARHDPWLASLGPDAFSRDELSALPMLVAVADAQRLEQGELASLTRLMLSERPVQILVEVDAARGPALAAASGHAEHRLELGLLGIAQRHAHVHQTSLDRPEHLAAAVERSLQASCAALHVVAALGASWPTAQAAIEARAHPLLHHDPAAGGSLTRRLELGGNPQAESTWPTYPLLCRREDGGEETLLLAFTFADYALLDLRLASHFRVVPDGIAADHLVPLADHVQHEGDGAAARLPFVWAVRPDGRMVRLVVSRPLALECRDRAATWSTLQELAGVRSDALTTAMQQVRTELAESGRAALATQQERHRHELETVRAESVASAMRRLAESLLSDDPAAFARRLTGATQSNGHPAVAASAPSVVPQPEVAETSAAPETPAATAPAVAEGPWVDTPLCTSCDDCVRLNPRLFVYDENKQVRIGDARAGTYAQLVKAAEKCPGRCIHPGEPLDPSEPGLDALRKRAAAFR